jgi:NitT/TauT family transport system substrate-binding protein
MSSPSRAKTRFATLAGAALAAGLLSTTALAQSPSAAPETGAPSGTTEVAYLLPFLRSIAFWPVHVAEEVGYFEEEGLSVASEATDGSSFVVQQVAAGNAEFGIATADPVLLGYNSSPTFQLVYDFLTGNVFDLWTVADSGVASIADLDGKVVAVKDLSGGEVPGLEIALEKAGLTPGGNVQIQPIGEEPAIQAEALRSGQVAAFMVSWNSLVGVRHALEAEGVELVCLTCESDQLLGSEGVIVPQAFVDSNPELVAGAGRALAKATLFGETNPDAAMAILATVNPEEQTDPELAETYFNAALEITAPRPPDMLYGEVDEEAWARSMELLQSPDLPSGLPGPVDLEALINNDFVADYNDFDHDAVIEQANNWEPTQ